MTVSLSTAPDPTVSFEVPTDSISTADRLMVWAFFDDPASQQVATYHWDFGDGATSAEPVGQHYYTAAGTYGITLTVTMVDGRSGSDSHSVTVTKFEGPDPIADFAWAPTTPDTQTDIQFTSTSSDPALVGIAAWAWTFDDGGSASGEQASHRFDTAGDHSVGLQVTTHDGRTATIEQTVTVGEYVPPDPVASFGFWPTEPFAGQVVQFFDLSSDPASIGVTDWAWDFGDGATGSGPSPSHGFAAVGTFTVGLTVTTADGRTGSTSQSITTTATPPPTAMFVSQPSDPTIHDTVQFSDISWDPAGLGITAWDWDLGDGSTADTSSVGHRYDADGDYTVSLTVETPDGRTSTTSQEVQVRTHDVAITDVTSPSSAKADRTKTVTIELVSRRRTEAVTVQLLRSTTAGYDVVDQRSVTMHRGVRQRVTFDYRFTGDDARLGWVSFKSIVNIDGLRDALPGDNEAISPPVKVVR
jgi:PKD repeat protein